MAKPVLLAVDDDPEVLRAVERDLRRQFGSHYRVLRADSGAAALEALQQLQVRNNPVALLLVDQRMPQMTGVEFLEQAVRICARKPNGSCSPPTPTPRPRSRRSTACASTTT